MNDLYIKRQNVSKKFDKELKKELRKSFVRKLFVNDKKPKTIKEKFVKIIMTLLMINGVVFLIGGNVKSLVGGMNLQKDKYPDKATNSAKDSKIQTSVKYNPYQISDMNDYLKNVLKVDIKYNDYINEGDILFSQKKYNDALAMYEKALAGNANLVDIYNKMANVYTDKGENDKAIQYYNKVIQINPNNALIYRFIGDLLIKQNNFQEAYDSFLKAINLKTNDIATYNNIAYVLVKLEKYNEALKYYDEALKINANDKAVLDNKQKLEQFLKSR